MNREKITYIIILQLILALYSVSGILSKMVASYQFLSFEFCCYYSGILFLLGVYAIVWQQVIKHLPLTVAFANKAITVIWGIIWGIMFFNETITIGQLVGAGIIITGIVLYSTDNTEVEYD